ncbi:glycosyltransferase family 52, partial [Vibrio rarus]
KILNFFDVKISDFNQINNSFSVLFTQPFSESRIDYSENSKIEGYKQILCKLGISEKLLVIKPHPAEKTRYRDYFPDSIIIESTFPAELMPLLGVKVNKVVTVTSSAAKSFEGKCDEIIHTKADDCFNFPKKLADGLERTVTE